MVGYLFKKTFEFEDLTSVAAKAALQQIKCAVRTAQNGVEKYRNNKGNNRCFGGDMWLHL